MTQAEEELARATLSKDAILTIGVFDGVHLGHRALLACLKEMARKCGCISGVVTFKQHPGVVISPQTKPGYLTDISEKTALLKKEGVNAIIALTFNKELADLTARQFLLMLQKYQKMKGLVLGPDFTMGHKAEGNIDHLQALGREMGFSVTVVPAEKINGEVISSTLIRDALAKGDMKKVRKLLGRYFVLHGRVIHGTGRGTGMGIPTANLELDPEQALPADGVYVTRATIDSKSYSSVTNIGKSPTFGGGIRTAEAHILDYNRDIYESQLRIELIEKLRSERKFASPDELKNQIEEDIKRARRILEALKE